MKRSVFAAVFVTMALVATCKPRSGAKCSTEGKRACGDEATLLVCQGGAYTAIPCKGAAGCASVGDGAACDISGNAAGEPCAADEKGRRVCTRTRRASYAATARR
jgi:hypothetical protein